MCRYQTNNILVDYEEDTAGDDLIVRSVQISDLEDAVLLSPGTNLQGCLRETSDGEARNPGLGRGRTQPRMSSLSALWPSMSCSRTWRSGRETGPRCVSLWLFGVCFFGGTCPTCCCGWF